MSFQCARCNRKEVGTVEGSHIRFMRLGLCSKCEEFVKNYIKGDMFPEHSERIRDLVNLGKYDSEAELINIAVSRYIEEVLDG